jgi:hypothetical protein
LGVRHSVVTDAPEAALRAFARLYGHVSFFGPPYEAAADRGDGATLLLDGGLSAGCPSTFPSAGG